MPPAISTRATSAAEAVVERVLEQYLKPGVTNLAPGQSHWSPPPHAVPPIADVRAASRYGACHGDAALLVALREKLERENRIPMADRGLMVTCGANQAFAHAMLALCDAADEVVLFAPYYFSHLVALQMFGLRPRILPCEAASGVPSLGALRGALDDAGGRVRAVVLVSPGNPSGTIVPEALGRAVLRECAARGVWLVTDEAYEHFTFGGDADGDAIPHASLAAPPTTPTGNADVDASERECVVSLFTFSKSYGMAGWRVGYLVYPRRLDGALLKVQDTLLTHAPLYCQRLALAALRDLGTPWVRAQVASLAPAREALWRAVAPLFELRRAATGGAPTPDKAPQSLGAFYFFVPVPEGVPEEEALRLLAEEYRLLLLPGSAFGAEGFLRLSYGALATTEVEPVAARLAAAAARLIAEHSKTTSRSY